MAERSSNYLQVRPEWLARRTEDAIEPSLPIVDAHHHLWDRPGWRYMLDELLADIDSSGHRIVSTVFVQCQTKYRATGPEAMRPVGETEFVAAVAEEAARRGHPFICAGIVGHADLRLGAAVASVLEAHLQAGAGRFRGIRHVTANDPDPSMSNPLSAVPPGLMADPAFREGFAQLHRHGLSFDAWLFHPQLDELTSLARTFPDTLIVLDHLGGILRIGAYAGQDTAEFTSWHAAIRRLAACPNVVVKLGGMGMRVNGFGFEQAAEPPSSETLATAWRPWMDACLQAFGADRCLFQSNFPVDKGSYSYGIGWNAFKRLAAGASTAERAALFGGTARRVYRLQDGDGSGALT